MENKVLIVLWCKGQRVGSSFIPLERIKAAYAAERVALELIQQDMPGIVEPNLGDGKYGTPYHQTVFHYNVVANAKKGIK